MTVVLAWIGRRRDGREHLFVASDSRTRGAYVFDSCPKILTLPRSDCALAFAGSSSETYPLMIQMANAIAAHEPLNDRSLDLARVKDHLLRVFTDLAKSFRQPATPLRSEDVQFLFAGYSWRSKDFRIWSILYSEETRTFTARESKTFHEKLRKVAFIGDQGRNLRGVVSREVNLFGGAEMYTEPLTYLARFIEAADANATIGGAPQIVRIAASMVTRPLCVRWQGSDTLLGRKLFDYENVDMWSVDPWTGRFDRPRKYGFRRDADAITIGVDGNEEN